MPEISLPVIVTLDDLAGSDLGHELAEADGLVAASGSCVEKFQTSTPTTTSTIQNSRLFSVEFTQGLQKRLEIQDYHGFVASLTRNGSPSACPATHTIRPSGWATTGTM